MSHTTYKVTIEYLHETETNSTSSYAWIYTVAEELTEDLPDSAQVRIEVEKVVPPLTPEQEAIRDALLAEFEDWGGDLGRGSAACALQEVVRRFIRSGILPDHESVRDLLGPAERAG